MRFVRVPLALLALVFVSALGLKYPDLPDSEMTPGVACPTVTVEMLSHAGYTAEVRANGTADGKKITDAVKQQVYAEYHITSHPAGDYEVDHLISLELGGSNDIRNLWPQPYQGKWNAHMKNRLENELHKRVINHEMTLADAQKEISTNWVALYLKIYPEDVTPNPVSPQDNAEPDNEGDGK